ncbi:hypothetical protein [Streptococcus pneumoniae]|uniref:hypothetical protein n=1 Tax=Streptococcus pneumoniae TaxID=1313 RepID=UPI000990C557|nr:hypothetical protein [Streptococcus pneumoniae]
MMSKQFLFYDIEIYFILYHAFFILSDDSLLPYLLAYLLPYIEKGSIIFVVGKSTIDIMEPILL